MFRTAFLFLVTACADSGTVGGSLVEDKLTDCTADALEPGDLVITEIMANPSACSDEASEWIEVLNTTDHDVDLAGLRLVDAGGNDAEVADATIVAAGARVVLGRSDAGTWCDPAVAPDGFYGGGLGLNNSGTDSVTLLNPVTDTVIDATPAFGATSGQAMGVRDSGANAVSNDDTLLWCSGTPTPGAPNGSCGVVEDPVDDDPDEAPEDLLQSCEVWLPDDYASVSSALAAVDGDVTICFREGSYSPSLFSVYGRRVTLLADGEVAFTPGSGTTIASGAALIVKGFTHSSLDIEMFDGEASFEGCTFKYGAKMDLHHDDARVSFVNGAFLELSESSRDGLFVSRSGASTTGADIEVINSTFVGFSSAIDSSAAMTIHNNVFLDNDYALDLDVDPVASDHNAFWGNTTNYYGQAAPGQGDIRYEDLLLDTSTSPPVPLAGSPLIGAANATVAPDTDITGALRDAQPDIGAVEHR